jgi:glutamate racemase
MKHLGPIGVFDSGYGGLTILEEVRNHLPDFDYLYLGDNARTPYGNRSFDLVYEFTRQAVIYLYNQGCPLVILACNTASAKALRTIQQVDLPKLDPAFRVLGVLRPTVEMIGTMTKTRHVGLLGTPGTISSNSYPLEIKKFFPDVSVTGEACPMWVPLVENMEHTSTGADYFVLKNLTHLMNKDPLIDAVILGCTHYPLLMPLIKKHLPGNVQLISQGSYVAESLEDYLKRHTEIAERCAKNSRSEFLTTESVEKFEESALIFINRPIKATRIKLD